MGQNKTIRLTVASRVLAGLIANPNIVGYHNCGWKLINCTDADIAGYALKLADELITAIDNSPYQPPRAEGNDNDRI